MEHVEHNFDPVFDKNSKVLILGTMPSVKSREENFYYGHPRNRFWKIISKITGCSTYNTIEEKKKMLIKNKIAVYDVIKSCDINLSSDSSIKNVEPSDIDTIVKNSNIKTVFLNGDKAFKLYNKYFKNKFDLKIIKLPSTSPANARFKEENLLEKWKVIKEYIC
ncbi:DNA-deoxyinosine glycosylase [Clostridium sp. BJN0001]|uniref:DNA-deoxyinosine glycosylase n=1 Tax=Clostridium sp. BJN0001 TaxID=2930219 RepID=UPI001FD070D5|nr:DNA-deoxyinosine glycosylase [Clostridium sp. BJN0001]